MEEDSANYEEPDSPKAKKRKACVSNQKYRTEYTDKWPVIVKSRRGENYVYCCVCRVDFSIKHSGMYDISRHVECQRHKSLSSSSQDIKSFFTKQNDDGPIRAEVLFTSFLIEHNIPLAAADHAGPLFKRMFPDSKIASQYGCARTKITAICGTLAKDDENTITHCMINGPYSLATDGSTDMECVKLYPLVICYFDVTLGQIMCVLLALLESPVSTGKRLFCREKKP